MKTRFLCWFVMLTLWMCEAWAAEAPTEASPPASSALEPLPAAAGTEFGPQAVPPACPGEYGPGPRGPGWWRNRLKPCLQYSHWGYCDLFEEVPFGARLRAHQRAQVSRGWAARLWLYRYDFCEDGAALNAAGHKRLSELAREFPVWSQHALVIESTPGRPQLDAARREHVAKVLDGAGAPAHVVIGVPTISAPFGDETREWNTLFMNQVRSGGVETGGLSGGGMSGAATQPSPY